MTHTTEAAHTTDATGTTDANNVLAVVSPHVGGRQAGAALATVFPGEARVTVVEVTDEDPAALREAHVIVTGLGPVTAEHIAAAPELRLIQCASHGFDYVDLDAARARDIPVCNIGSSGAEKQNVLRLLGVCRPGRGHLL